ncbi:G-protein coupled receptor Mth2-like [Parasteatoda tepidariorum]|uniref:G-protein coupled receptor Mth2-like n=1 Tax=Parasteatoda tepidariorum TaxID=114398 RepID=UPI001C726402|nr:G-protein coupled receptor Mth2-like [Parasteatoda tepidariorum]
MELYFYIIAFTQVMRSYGNPLLTISNSSMKQTQPIFSNENTATSSLDSKYAHPFSANLDSDHTNSSVSDSDSNEAIISTSNLVSNSANTSTSDTSAKYIATASNLDFQKHCARVILDIKNVEFLANGNMFIPSYNTTIHPSKMHIIQNDRRICFYPTEQLKKELFKHCGTFEYNADEFKHLLNGSVILYGVLLEDEVYEVNKAGKLVLCSMDYDDIDEDEFNKLLPKPMDDTNKAALYIGNIGSAISILALLIHIVTFCLVPSLRNLPGYNLASLGVAFLMAYSFSLIVQIPQVFGKSCVLAGILKQYFFLVAFFWMNVMAFDVWKTLRMATERLMVSNKSARLRQFLWYSSYAWLVPLCIVSVCVGLDNSKNVSEKIKPLYGKNGFCWLTNDVAKGIFFSLPAFVLFLSNAVFFVLSAFILKNNTMKQTVESDQRQTAQLNLVLHIRLAVMMGITWLIGAIGIIFSYSEAEWLRVAKLDTVVWFLFDILNSLQGLFVFLLFTCSRKVFKHIQDRMSMSTLKTKIEKYMFGECLRNGF